MELKWRSFAKGCDNPITVSFIIRRAEKAGADAAAIMMLGKDEFDECEFEILSGATELININSEETMEHPLSRFVLNGNSEAMANELTDVSFVMDQLALSGQLTVIFGSPNDGKSLITLHSIRQSIRQSRIDGANVFYFNFDDNAQGLVEKLKIAEECGFWMLCDGYNGFNVNEFAKYIGDLTSSSHASKTIIILDNAKKFTNLMDKVAASRFTSLLRKFCTKGGAGIALAHNNKHPRDGKGVPGGTSDLLDDFDCGYVIDPISDSNGKRIVEFRNVKSRGPVAKSVAFSYSTITGISYRELLDSVQMVDAEYLDTERETTARQIDAPIIDAIRQCITEGVISKMDIKVAASQRSKASHGTIMDVLEKYTGDDPATHLWNFHRAAHGRQNYYLHQKPDDDAPHPGAHDGT